MQIKYTIANISHIRTKLVIYSPIQIRHNRMENRINFENLEIWYGHFLDEK